MEFQKFQSEDTLSILSSSHRRLNPLTNEWVLVSPHRTKRPWQGQTEDDADLLLPSYVDDCYLCPGNKRVGGLHNPDYKKTYVFKNDFAALTQGSGSTGFKDSLLEARAEEGICKVVCFSPDHSLSMAELPITSLKNVILTWKSEFEELSRNPMIKNIQIFENKGQVMGCSNPHPHGQIWAQNSIPNEIYKRTENQQRYYKEKGVSLLSDYVGQELRSGERIVCENEFFVCLVPFWAVWPYETMLIPKRHFQSILDMTEKEIGAFASILSEITIRYDNIFECSFPYSAGMQQRPVDVSDYPGWHFHYSFYPPLLRSSKVRKFMVGYEMFANPQRDITAESAAATLRNVSKLYYKKK